MAFELQGVGLTHGTGFRAHVDAALIAHVRLCLEQAARLLPRDRR